MATSTTQVHQQGWVTIDGTNGISIWIDVSQSAGGSPTGVININGLNGNEWVGINAGVTSLVASDSSASMTTPTFYFYALDGSLKSATAHLTVTTPDAVNKFGTLAFTVISADPSIMGAVLASSVVNGNPSLPLVYGVTSITV